MMYPRLSLVFLIVLCGVGSLVPCTALINMTEYKRIPPVYELEDFEDCFRLPEPVYCTIDVQLSANGVNPVYELIKNFSLDLKRRLPHSVLKRGVCANNWYEKKQKPPKGLNDKILDKAMEAYVKKNIALPYKLNAKVVNKNCRGPEWNTPMGALDWGYYGIFIIILGLNALGSCYYFGDRAFSRFIQCFSICQNWTVLMRRPNPDTRGLHGFRYLNLQALIILNVIAALDNAHVQNTEYLENKAQSPSEFISVNYTITLQTFFCVSGFFLSYKFFKRLGDVSFNFWMYPCKILEYVLRFSPLYILVLGYYCTFYARAFDGPLWPSTVGAEAMACKQNFWHHILYFNNYVRYEQECFSDSWYLAAEFQLFVLGLALLMIIWRFPSWAKQIFFVALTAAIISPVYVVYVNRLFPYHTSFTESLRNFNFKNEEFRRLYITMEGNASGYIIGMIGGYINYKVKDGNIKLAENPRFQQWVGWSPLLNLCSIILGSRFLVDTYRYLPIHAALYSIIFKPLNAVIVSTLLLGLFNNVQQPLMALFKSPLFYIPGKLTYTAFLINNIIINHYFSQIRKPFFLYDSYWSVTCYGAVAYTLSLCVYIHLLVELPLRRLQEMLLSRPNTKTIEITQGHTTPVSEVNNTQSEPTSSTNTNAGTDAPTSRTNTITNGQSTLTQSTATLSTLAQSTESVCNNGATGYDNKGADI